MNCKNIVLWFIFLICIQYFFEIESSTCNAERNGILKGRFLSELAHVTVLRAQQVYNTNSYLEDVIYFLDEINMQFQPSIKYAIVNSWNLILKMKVEMPSLKFNFTNELGKRWNLRLCFITVFVFYFQKLIFGNIKKKKILVFLK